MGKKTTNALRQNKAIYYYLQSTGLTTNALSTASNFLTRLIQNANNASFLLSMLGILFSGVSFLSSTIATIYDPRASKTSRITSAGILAGAILGAPLLIYVGVLFPVTWLYIGVGMMTYSLLSSSYNLYNKAGKEYTLGSQYENNHEQYLAHIKEKREAILEELNNTSSDDKQTLAKIVYKLFKLDKKIAFAEQHGAKALYIEASTLRRTHTIGSYIDFSTSLTSLITGVIGFMVGVATAPLGPILLGISLFTFVVNLSKSLIQFDRKVQKNNQLVDEILTNDKYLSLIDKELVYSKQDNGIESEESYSKLLQKVSQNSRTSPPNIEPLVDRHNKTISPGAEKQSCTESSVADAFIDCHSEDSNSNLDAGLSQNTFFSSSSIAYIEEEEPLLPGKSI